MELRNISKNFGGESVIEDFSFVFEKGKVYCVTGASGSGKTTLLRIIAGLDSPDSGSADGIPGTVSVMFQEDRLLPCSAEKNLTVVCRDKEKAEEYLGKVRLSDAKEKTPREMSGGMKRRVALARALCCDAELYVFDEPFASLDRDTALGMARLIKEEMKGKTAVIATHFPECAEILADETIRR